jgi:hypothetical protein
VANELRTMPTDVAAGLNDMITATFDTANGPYSADRGQGRQGRLYDTAVAGTS